MFGIQNIRNQFVLDSHLLCIHGEQKQGNYKYEKLPDVLQSLFIEVSAKFLRWYLFKYLKPKCVFASCGPDVFCEMDDIVDAGEKNFQIPSRPDLFPVAAKSERSEEIL